MPPTEGLDVYRPRNQRASSYYRCVESHFEELEQIWDDRYASRFGFWRPYVTKVIYGYSRIGPGATPADVMFLERFCDKVSEQVWRLSAQKVLECTENGVSIDEIQTFLEARNRNELPLTMIVFLKDMKQRTGQVKDAGPARLIECASDAIALLIANDTKLKGLCMLAGDRHLVVPVENEMQFKKALRGLGYGLTSNG